MSTEKPRGTAQVLSAAREDARRDGWVCSV